VVPVVYGFWHGHTNRLREKRDLVIGGTLPMYDRAPKWECLDCGYGFTDIETEELARWDALILTMLPQPVRSGPGGLEGGEPGEVIVRVCTDRLQLGAYCFVWLSNCFGVATTKRWHSLPLDSDPKEVARQIQELRAERLRTYSWCPNCKILVPPEDLEVGGCGKCVVVLH